MLAIVLSLVASACAYTVTVPNQTQGWTNVGNQTLSWTRVVTDANNFTVVLVNEVGPIFNFGSLTYLI